jgi:hypothetical protein
MTWTKLNHNHHLCYINIHSTFLYNNLIWWNLFPISLFHFSLSHLWLLFCVWKPNLLWITFERGYDINLKWYFRTRAWDEFSSTLLKATFKHLTEKLEIFVHPFFTCRMSWVIMWKFYFSIEAAFIWINSLRFLRG